jgi:hypothetical protein
MKARLQFVRWMLGAALCGAVSLTCAAQKNHPAPPPPRHNHTQYARQNHPQYARQKPPKQQNQSQPKQNPNRPPASQSHPVAPPPSVNHPNQGAGAGANNAPGRNLTPRQQLGVGAPKPWLQTMRSLTPAQRERFFQNSSAFRSMSPEKQNRIRQQFNQWDHMTPQQRADQVDRENTWRQLTPAQRQHIKSDVFPRYQQLPPERQKAINRRLEILKNMPESARNQRLSDPKFTEGMNDEDKAMLHDLSHMHVGGAPDPPGE